MGVAPTLDFTSSFSSLAKDFLYEHVLVVSGIVPSHGHVGVSGQVVTVLGASFEHTDGLACHFGPASARALFLSSSSLACSVPAHQEGSLSVAVSTLI